MTAMGWLVRLTWNADQDVVRLELGPHARDEEDEEGDDDGGLEMAEVLPLQGSLGPEPGDGGPAD